MTEIEKPYYMLIYALKGVKGSISDGPYKTLKAAEIAGRRKKGQGHTRWWTTTRVDPGETFKEWD